LKHQQAPTKKLGRKFDDGGWYARGQRAVRWCHGLSSFPNELANVLKPFFSFR
jgi:hypothetical protein